MTLFGFFDYVLASFVPASFQYFYPEDLLSKITRRRHRILLTLGMVEDVKVVYVLGMFK